MSVFFFLLIFMVVCSIDSVGHQSPDTSVTVHHARRARMVAFVSNAMP